jgi:hypothetical protein
MTLRFSDEVIEDVSLPALKRKVMEGDSLRIEKLDDFSGPIRRSV